MVPLLLIPSPSQRAAQGAKVGHHSAAVTEGVLGVAAGRGPAHDGAAAVDSIRYAVFAIRAAEGAKVAGGVLGAGQEGGARQGGEG